MIAMGGAPQIILTNTHIFYLAPPVFSPGRRVFRSTRAAAFDGDRAQGPLEFVV